MLRITPAPWLTAWTISSAKVYRDCVLCTVTYPRVVSSPEASETAGMIVYQNTLHLFDETAA